MARTAKAASTVAEQVHAEGAELLRSSEKKTKRASKSENGKHLVIVESPSKIGPIKKYLGANYRVIASQGHVRDLPKSTLGVDIENDFAAHYINIRGRGDLIKEIRKEAKLASKIYLATDPDREGEAISWHLATVLGIAPEDARRITFNEVTKTAVKAAVKNPRALDMNLVNAQQARRILDRIVGYKLSPFLWKTVKSGLSAGRVQSVAARIIVDREEEIRAFIPEEYWTIDAVLLTEEQKSVSVHFYGDANGKISLSNEEETMRVVHAVENQPFTVSSVKHSTRHKAPAPPFITSSLQQEAFNKLNFQSSRTMRVAQELYEGVNVGTEFGGVQGLITYMRTDSLRVSTEAQESAKALITERYGEKFYPAQPRVYKSGSDAQDAHEAIRPTRIDLDPAMIRKSLTPDQYKLYKLIWERFVASQMESATLKTLTVDFDSSGYIFRTSGYTVEFPGYMALYEESEVEENRKADNPKEVKDIRIPDLAEGEKLKGESITPLRHFTEPPARYNEGSLVKFLKEKGIGRPSTYAQIISTITTRGYVKREGKSLVPTPLGEVTTKLMKERFPDIVDYRFTANIEEGLDDIEGGEKSVSAVLTAFWEDFSEELKEAEEVIGTLQADIPPEETDIICDKCGAKMIVRNGRYGKFAACPNYPTCKNTKPLTEENGGENAETSEKTEEKKPVSAGFACELCGADMVERVGRYGTFFACSNYPECKNTKQKRRELGVSCPKCGGMILVKTGRNRTVFYSCEHYPDCDFSSWDMPLEEKCPVCGKILFRKKGKNLVVCKEPTCNYHREEASTEAVRE